MARFWSRRGNKVSEEAGTPPVQPSAAQHQSRVFDRPPAELERLGDWIKMLSIETPGRVEYESEMAELLRSLPTHKLPRFDRDIRWLITWRTIAWDTQSVEDAVALMEATTEPLAVAAGFSMHKNGRIRQAAIEHLAKQGPDAIRWLVLRCGDWVPEVADEARRAVEQWLQPEFAPMLLDVDPLLSGGRFGSNRRASDLPARFEAVLREPASRPALEAAISSSDKFARRSAVKILTSTQGATVELLEVVSQTGDVAATGHVAHEIPNEGPINIAAGRVLRDSPVARFRAQGLWRLTKDDDAGSEAMARDALWDRSNAVRDVAQRWLIRHEIDPVPLYLSKLDESPQIALSGLGDRPNAGFLTDARRYLDHETTGVRCAAMRILAALGDASDRPMMIERFLHGSVRERRYATATLRRIGMADAMDDVWSSALASGDQDQLMRVAGQLLPLSGRWTRLDIGFQALASDDEDVRDLGFAAISHLLDTWNNSPAGPPVDRALLAQRFETARPVLNDPRYKRRFLIESLESLVNRA